MIKLTQLLELDINNPNITPKKIGNYVHTHLVDMDINNFNIWDEYREICKPYVKKYFSKEYNIDFLLNKDRFNVFSRSECNKFYNDLVQLIEKYKLNELGINNPNPTAEEVLNYYNSAFSNTNSTADFIRIVKPIVKKYGYKFPMGAKEFIISLDQQKLNQIYKELKSEFN